jgi:predicted transcriptional regulator
VVRPRDSSYRSYNLILTVLDEGPRSFEELWKSTKLHRNTVSSRLKHLVSEGLVTKTREKHRVQYALVEPIDVTRWNEISFEIWKEIGKRKLMKVFREWMNTEAIPGLTKLENLPENKDLLDSQELSEGFPDWEEELSADEYYSMLKINHDLTEKMICPNCFHKVIVEDILIVEIACRHCGYVMEDETVSLKKRVEAISFLLKKTPEERQAGVILDKKENADDEKGKT